MLTLHFQNKFIAYAAGLVLLFNFNCAHADPSARVARLGYLDGQVSFSPAGDGNWVQAALNRPLTTGDHVWADSSSRAEIQIGGAAIRLGAKTDVMIINLDDQIAQVQLSQGSVRIRVHQIARNQSFEVDTPNLSLTLSQAGEYRIDVDPSGDSTQVTVQIGQGQVYGDDTSYVVKAGQGYRFYGTNLSDYETLPTQTDDDLDRWSHDLDRRIASSNSARYVSYEVVGYEDLDVNGSWRSDPSYGNVWRPNRVPSGWTPYRDGHWAWIDPWGWNWVDNAPWGYAVSHYGRWAHVSGSWGWIPGPRREPAVYAPALVVFLGGKNFQDSVPVGGGGGTVGWFPLAPREVYQPAYQVSRAYFDRVNRSNAVISTTSITNIYNTSISNSANVVINEARVVYVNQRVPGAVVAVPKETFAQSHSVTKLAVAVSKDSANRGETTHVAEVLPTTQSIHGGAPEARSKPPTHERRFLARTAPPAPTLAFAAQQAQLAEKPGIPIDDQQRKKLTSTTQPESSPSATVVPVAKAVTPTAAPPAVASKGRSSGERKSGDAKTTPSVGDTSKTDSVKVLRNTAESAYTAASHIPSARAETDKKDQANAGPVKADQAKATAARAELLRAENSRAAAAKAEGEKANAAKANRAKDDAAKAEAIRAAGVKAETDKVSRARAGAAKAEAIAAENARAASVKVERDKVNLGKSEPTKALPEAKGPRARASEPEKGRIAD